MPAPTATPTQIVERIVERVIPQPVRQKLPRTRTSRTFEFRVADCKGFATIGEYADGRPGEIFLTVSKQGSTLSGIMDAFAKSISYGLQYGVPMRAFVEAFTNMRFEPAGMTDDPDIRFVSSIMDYLFRRLALEYLSLEERAGARHLLHRGAAAAHAARRRGVGHPDLDRQRDGARPEVDPVGERAGHPDGARDDDARRPARLGESGAGRPPRRRAHVHAVRRADDPLR